MPEVLLRRDRRPLVSAGIVLGVGLGGFLDGIVFHQLLQWHTMLSARLPPTSVVALEVNMFWDGVFHAFTWLTTVVGIGLLWRALRHDEVPRSARALIGAMLLGWGLFNVVEGVINHHVLQLHHVVHGDGQHTADLAFLAAGFALIAIGWWLVAVPAPRRPSSRAGGLRPAPRAG